MRNKLPSAVQVTSLFGNNMKHRGSNQSLQCLPFNQTFSNFLKCLIKKNRSEFFVLYDQVSEPLGRIPLVEKPDCGF